MSRDDLGDRGTRVPAPARAPRGVDRADPGRAEAGRVRRGQVHALTIIVQPEPQAAALDAPQHVVRGRGLVGAGAGCAAGLLVGVGHERAEPLEREVERRPLSPTGVDPAPAAERRVGRVRRASCVGQPRDSSTREPGGLVGALPDGGQAPRSPPVSDSPRSCSTRANSRAAGVGIGSRKAGRGANGALRMPAPTTAPARSRTTSHQSSSGWAWRSATARAVRSATVATTVLTTGSRARCSPAAARNSRASATN